MARRSVTRFRGGGAAAPASAAQLSPPSRSDFDEDVEAPEFGPDLADPAPDLSALLPPRIGPVDRLIRFAFARGVKPSTLARPFRKPARLRLLATVEQPVPGDRAAGMALRAGHFQPAGKKLPIEGLDFTGETLGRPAAEAIHRFDWLADLDAAGSRGSIAPLATSLFGKWLAANDTIGAGEAWTVACAGQRLLTALIHAPLILSDPDPAARRRALLHLAATARWLDRKVRREDTAQLALPGWAALVAAGLLFPDGKPRRLFAEAGLIAALGDAIGEDGGMLSRSPLDQAEAMALLLRVRACYRACRRESPEQIDIMLRLLAPPLLATTHADGSLASWQGAPPLSARQLAVLTQAGEMRARPLRDPRGWGYRRIAARRSVLLFDAAPPPSGPQAHGGCASTLALEFSHDEQRILVSCGGALMAGGMVPAEIEEALRATAAHSTLVLADSNSTAVLRDGRLGLGVRSVAFERGTGEDGRGARMTARHDGYAARHGLLHERTLVLAPDGLTLDSEDALLPARKKAKRGSHAFAIRFHLGPGIEIGHAHIGARGGRGLGLALPDGSYWQFRSLDAALAVEDSLWVDRRGCPRATRQLVLTGEVGREGGRFAWQLRCMG